MANEIVKDLLKENGIEVIQTEIPAGYTSFRNDTFKGKSGENIFEEYLCERNIKYNNVTTQHKTDFVVDDTIYEIKANYQDNDILIIETISDDGILSGTAKLKKGWWYTSTANYFVFISCNTQVKIQLTNNNETKELFKSIRERYSEIKNKKSFDKYGNEWQSWFIPVPLSEFNGYYEFL